MNCFLAEILVLDNEVIVFKSGSDCRFYVVGSGEEVSFLMTHDSSSIINSQFGRMN